MNNNYKKLLKSGLMGAAVIAACSSCSDTWDEHYDVSPTSANKTLWEQIQANPELSDFAQLCETIHYRKNESDTSRALTYADLLKGSTVYTVFAPVNGRFNLSEWQAKGDTYEVAKEFMNNHICRYSYVIRDKGEEQITLLNNKLGAFVEGANPSFGGVSITTKNIPASNGTLHCLNGESAFLPNLYEYMFKGEGLDSVANFMKKYEYKELTSYVTGPTVNGVVTYLDVDSTVYNHMFTQMEAWLNREDSSYVMVLPKNELWKQQLEETQKMFNYRDSYTQTTVNEDGTESEKETKVNADSLNYFNSRMLLLANNVFNANYQKGIKVDQYGKLASTDSLTTTNYRVLRNDTANLLMGGKTFADFVPMSNGYAVPVDQSVSMINQYLTVNIRASHLANIDAMDKVYASTSGNYKLIDWDDTYQIYSYREFVPQSTIGGTQVTFKLTNLFSGRYDVYVVVLPELTVPEEERVPYRFRGSMTFYTKAEGKPTTINSKYTGNVMRDESSIPVYDGKSATGDVTLTEKTASGTGVLTSTVCPDTVMLFKGIEVPYSYYGLGSKAYPTLSITSNYKSAQKTLYTNHLFIEKLIIKPSEY